MRKAALAALILLSVTTPSLSQDMSHNNRIDLIRPDAPALARHGEHAIGVRTIEACAKAGLAGVVGEAGALLVLERDEVIAAADRLGLFVWGEPHRETET